jgi:hypothetical protein
MQVLRCHGVILNVGVWRVEVAANLCSAVDHRLRSTAYLRPCRTQRLVQIIDHPSDERQARARTYVT